MKATVQVLLELEFIQDRWMSEMDVYYKCNEFSFIVKSENPEEEIEVGILEYEVKKRNEPLPRTER